MAVPKRTLFGVGLVVVVLAGAGIWLLVSTASGCDVQPPTSVAEIENLRHVEFCSGRTTLVGKLTVPEGEGSFPLVAFAHGSGTSTTRDAYDFLVPRMRAAGYATFVPDKRGVGDSGGSYRHVGEGNSTKKLQTLADDLLAAVDHLKGLQEIDADQIGLMGGSQAGWVIAMAAPQSTATDFVVIVNGATNTLGESMFWEEITSELRTRGQRGMILVPLDETERAQMSAQLAAFDGTPRFDPRESIEQMTIPGLWVWGDQDPNVAARECRAILEEIIAEYDKPFTVHYNPDGGHTWMDADLDAIMDWLAQQTST